MSQSTKDNKNSSSDTEFMCQKIRSVVFYESVEDYPMYTIIGMDMDQAIDYVAKLNNTNKEEILDQYNIEYETAYISIGLDNSL